MKKIILILCLLLTMGTFVLADEEINSIKAGVTPDSPMYGFDKAIDGLSLAFTFGNANKAEKGIKIAQERLMEAQEMADKDKPEQAERAREEHQKAIEKAEQELDKLKEGNDVKQSKSAIEKVAKIQEKIESHYQKVSEVKDAVLERMRDRKTPEQFAKMEEIFNKIKTKALEMETKTDAKKEKVKEKYKLNSGKTDAEVEYDENNINAEVGLTNGREERAQREIKNAEEAITKAKAKLKAEKDKGSDISDFEEELDDIAQQIKTANKAKDNSDNKNARNIAEKIKEYGNEVSVIATKLGEARIAGNFNEVKAQLNIQIEARHDEKLNWILKNAPEESKQEIRNIMENSYERRSKKIYAGTKPDTTSGGTTSGTTFGGSSSGSSSESSSGDSTITPFESTGSAGPAIVTLGTAGDFIILSKAGISTTGTTHITGDIGVSPIDGTGLAGFGIIMDSSNTFATSSLVTGKLYAADYTSPTPTKMTTAVNDMEIAYIDAAGRTNPTVTELGAGDISGMTLNPGLYKWGTGLLINNEVTLDCQGNSNAIFIFQIAEDLTVSNGAIVILSGGCQAKNIFWQVASQATLGTTSDFKGNILSYTNIDLQTGAVLNGRALAQTAVTLDANVVTKSN
jgi:hypothetical protein